MRTSVARSLLDGMLAGKELDEADIRKLVAVDGESLYVDFKNGAELEDRKKAAKTLRQYTAGFANADGGLLVIGVSDGGGDATQRRFTPTKRPGGLTLHEWARTVLESIAGGLSPPPRLQTVTVDGVDVLVVGVGRAPSLVVCPEEGGLRYYLRMGDSTLAIPPYLITDLILGRRSHPEFEVTGSGWIDGDNIRFVFDVLNESMVAAEDVFVGIVSSAISERNGGKGRAASAYLRQFVDDLPHWSARDDRLELVHLTPRREGPRVDLPAFGRHVFDGILLTVPRGEKAIPVRSAFHVIANGHPPQWFQLNWYVPPRQVSNVLIDMTRTYGERPEVQWGSEWRQ